MVGIVIVSHSYLLGEGVKELALQMASKDFNIVNASGLEDHSIGTNVETILNAIKKADSGKGVLIMVDLGSAVMSTNMAIEMLEEEDNGIKAIIADAPIVEGTVSAAVSAFSGDTLEEVLEAALEVKTISKL